MSFKKIKDTYWNTAYFIKCKCDICGHVDKNYDRDTFSEEIFHRKYETLSIFRGDDELVKTVCTKCWKEDKR